MPFEFEPKALEFVLQGQYAERRLKNRCGSASCADGDEPFFVTGDIIPVWKEARAFEARTGMSVLVREYRCGAESEPSLVH